MSGPDFLTVDAFHRPPGGRIRWRRNLRRLIDNGVDGLRGTTVNYANNGTRSLAPNLVPGGCALVAEWESAEAAEAAFAGPSRRAIDGPGRFSLDSDIVRVKIDSESERDHWHGWKPNAEGAEPLDDGEPMVAIVHGILRRGRLVEFVRNNCTRQAVRPTTRGIAEASTSPPTCRTSTPRSASGRPTRWPRTSLTRKGGHASAMTHALKEKTHRVGVFLQARPLGCTGTLGIDKPPYPQQPEARRAGI